jgi:2-amino-4-hydroxy-6-hydroxymethyldihydropteridine diphosphokinase
LKTFKNAILGLGGNVGDREFLLDSAIRECSELGRILKSSSIYETSAWGGVAKGAFLNQVILLETEFDPETLLIQLRAIEQRLGRQRTVHWGDRTMDIDLLFFEKEIVESENLVIPHPAIAYRRFVLAPLCEILPGFVHPILGKTAVEMLLDCPDKEEVKKYNP